MNTQSTQRKNIELNIFASFVKTLRTLWLKVTPENSKTSFKERRVSDTSFIYFFRRSSSTQR